MGVNMSNVSTRAAIGDVTGGSDANLIKKLIMLEQERKLLTLVHEQQQLQQAQQRTGVRAPVVDSLLSSSTPTTAALYCSYDDAACTATISSSMDIYVDPKIVHSNFPDNFSAPVAGVGGTLDAQVLPNNEQVLPNNEFTACSRAIDAVKLNQAHYFADAPPTTACVATSATATSTVTSTAVIDTDNATLSSSSVPLNYALSPQEAADIDTLLLQRPLLVIIRHGKTEHNKLGLFTGWEDAALAAEGRNEARYAGKLLRRHGIEVSWCVCVCVCV